MGRVVMVAVCALVVASAAALAEPPAARAPTPRPARAANPVTPPDRVPANAPLVVIDPGHGGTNAGAPSVREGVFEKAVTLAYARELASRLRARGVRVALTRRDDRYLSLRQRARFANERRADLFVSLHGNASPDRAWRGFETFVLSPEALDIDGRALRVDDGAPRLGVSRDIGLVLDDIERGVSLPQAAMLARRIQRELRQVRGRTEDRGVRQESHHVLLGATMPAVLVEIGFVDHPVEGVELLDPVVRAQICEALAKAIAP